MTQRENEMILMTMNEKLKNMKCRVYLKNNRQLLFLQKNNRQLLFAASLKIAAF